jgi:protein DGCR14
LSHAFPISSTMQLLVISLSLSLNLYPFRIQAMAGIDNSGSVVRRPAQDVALMPPPPFKRIKRAPNVIDEDVYTSALSEIIARDYFPGLRETRAQQEYLDALESNDESWIAAAAMNLRDSIKSPTSRRRSIETAFDGRRSQRGTNTPKRALDTPRGNDGSETPTITDENTSQVEQTQSTDTIDITSLSLSQFHSKYTSEDNDSFNTLLDKQNLKRREKHAYMWTADQRIPSARQIAHRERERRLIETKQNDEKNGKALIPMTQGAIEDRPARPDAWTIKKPDNSLMFIPRSVDEDGIETEQERKEAASKAGEKRIVYENTRFPSLEYLASQPPDQIPPSPSLNTEIIEQRDAARLGRAGSDITEYPGGETPRVNGYAFVDEDEPSQTATIIQQADRPSYRDLLAGQVGESTPNPFNISSTRRREEIHRRLVEKTAKKNREKERLITKPSGIVGMTPTGAAGNMTPAAKKLMEKLGRTPVNVHSQRMSSAEMWTPRETPRRKAMK